MLKAVEPLMFCCSACRRSKSSIGVKWVCGHISCCRLSCPEEWYCPIAACNTQERIQKGWLFPPDVPEMSEAGVVWEDLKLLFDACPKHPTNQALQAILESQSPLPIRGHCARCLRSRGVSKSDMIFSILQATRSITEFRTSYLKMDEVLKRHRLALGFRRALDFVAASLVRGLAEVGPSDMLNHRGIYRFSKRKKEFVEMEDVRLVVLGHHIEALLKAGNKRAVRCCLTKMAALVESLLPEANRFRVVDEVTMDPQQACLAAEDVPRSPGSQELTDFFSRCPLFYEKKPSLPTSWARLVPEPVSYHRTPKKRLRQFFSVRFQRQTRTWRTLIDQSGVMKGRDLSLLMEKFSPISRSDLLAQITEEQESGSIFHRQAYKKSNTLLLVRTKDSRFGFLSTAPWPIRELGREDTAFLFRLDTRTIFPQRPTEKTIPPKSEGRCPRHYGPLLQAPDPKQPQKSLVWVANVVKQWLRLLPLSGQFTSPCPS